MSGSDRNERELNLTGAPGVQTPSVEAVDRITAASDLFIRNLRITHSYHQLAVAFSVLTRGNANWCSFATWASKQAGQTIRGEDLPQALERALRAREALSEFVNNLWRRLLRPVLSDPESKPARLIREIYDPFEVFRLVSEAVAASNKKVFEEIGREFVRFLALSSEGPLSAEAVPGFCVALREGDPPDGQTYLRQAFTHYFQAFARDDPQARAELMLLANLEIGLHEQTRLQPEIAQALNAPVTRVRELGDGLLAVLFPGSPRWLSIMRRLLAGLAGALGKFAEGPIRKFLRHAITEALMTLTLSDGTVLHLGADLTAQFPAVLRNLTNDDLLKLLARFEPGPGAPDHSAAYDWSVLPERMHYIIHLFRAFHEDPRLFAPPFTPEQVQLIEQGVLPDGNL